jgi:hypothetical protein
VVNAALIYRDAEDVRPDDIFFLRSRIALRASGISVK